MIICVEQLSSILFEITFTKTVETKQGFFVFHPSVFFCLGPVVFKGYLLGFSVLPELSVIF